MFCESVSLRDRLSDCDPFLDNSKNDKLLWQVSRSWEQSRYLVWKEGPHFLQTGLVREALSLIWHKSSSSLKVGGQMKCVVGGTMVDVDAWVWGWQTLRTYSAKTQMGFDWEWTQERVSRQRRKVETQPSQSSKLSTDRIKQITNFKNNLENVFINSSELIKLLNHAMVHFLLKSKQLSYLNHCEITSNLSSR